ncbi:MAG TPA: cytochrome c biogenesis heme-transporting ATPase CcmA [Steroidobacteraceae bacterium]|nr:cytochrome c biogenesis heme-transporting ATPase CcmA [Steroidobacteraceae bacterium]
MEKAHVWRGDRHVLKGVSLELHSRELMHVSGPNGAGKTTLLRVACGLLRPEQGRVSWCGRPIGSIRAEFQGALAYAAHEPALKGDLTALENLRYMIGLKRRHTRAELEAALERTGVGSCAHLPVRVLSAGQRRRAVMARVLATRAALWVLDEPFTNLDAAGSALVSGLLAEHLERGGMALVVAHHELPVAGSIRRLDLQA